MLSCITLSFLFISLSRRMNHTGTSGC